MPGRAGIVVTTFGWLAVFTCIAIALERRRRGHEVILAIADCYRDYVAARGLGFCPVSPDCDWLSQPGEMTRYIVAARLKGWWTTPKALWHPREPGHQR